jgi:hypothetical protein
MIVLPAVFATLAVIVLGAALLWWGGKPKFPGKADERSIETMGAYRLHLVMDGPEFQRKAIAIIALRSIEITCRAWQTVLKVQTPLPTEFVLHMMPDSEFDLRRWARGVTSYPGWSGAHFYGRGLPLIAMRRKLAVELLNSGEPVIHETLHALCARQFYGTTDFYHKKPLIWFKDNTTETVQGMARNEFRSWRKRVRVVI